MKETNHTGSRNTNKHSTGAKNDLALPVTLQFISSASWEANTRFFFPVLHVSPCREVLKDVRVRTRKGAAEAAQKQGASTSALAIIQGRQSQSHIPGHRNQRQPSRRQLSPAPGAAATGCGGRRAGSRCTPKWPSAGRLWGTLATKAVSKC